MFRVSQQVRPAELERRVRDSAARLDDVIVLADRGAFRRLRRLESRLHDEPVPGCSVKRWNLPSGGGILAVSAGPFWAED